MRSLLLVLVALLIFASPVHGEPREDPPKIAQGVNAWDSQPAILWLSTKAWHEAEPRPAPARRRPPRSSAPRSKRSGSTADCIAARENGGDYGRSSNPTHFGKYQYDRQTWAAHGGDPSTWGSASPEEQERVFAEGTAKYGYGAWTPYDGC